MEKVMTTFRIDRDMHEQLKSKLEQKGMTMQGFILLSIRDFLLEHPTGPEADACQKRSQ